MQQSQNKVLRRIRVSALRLVVIAIASLSALFAIGLGVGSPSYGDGSGHTLVAMSDGTGDAARSMTGTRLERSRAWG